MPDENGRHNRWAGPLRYAGAGIELAVAVGLGAFAGQWLDRKTGAAGIFTIVGAMLGFGASLYWLVQALRDSGSDGS
ncbi:MAG TPA: AtpZ/AtpI family protein [Gemmatimonadales bacterium]|nr:AtpZ/AtpI family protein [Gemmatimonadales bacterium]